MVGSNYLRSTTASSSSCTGRDSKARKLRFTMSRPTEVTGRTDHLEANKHAEGYSTHHGLENSPDV